MRSAAFALAFSLAGFVAGGTFFIAASLVLAWTGPTSAPPNGNVSAPINVGATNQVKRASSGRTLGMSWAEHAILKLQLAPLTE